MLLALLAALLVLVAHANAASADDAVDVDAVMAGDGVDDGARHRADEVEARQLADALTGIELDDNREAWQRAFGDLELDDADRATSILDARVPEASTGVRGDALAAGALERGEARARRSPLRWGHLDLDVAWRWSWRAPLRASAYRSSELWLLATWRR